MFYRFPFYQAGFTEEEWEEMPRGNKVIVRDYFLNKKDREQCLLYGEFETVYQVRKVEKYYDLESRPEIIFCAEDFNF